MVLVGVLIALSIIHIRTSVVRLSPGRVDHHALLLPDRSLSTDDVRGVLTSMGQPMTAALVMLVLRSPASGTTLRLTGGVWTFDALETIARHAGVRVSDRQMSGMDIERLVPGSLPLRYRRPWAFGLGTALVIVALITAGVVGWFAYRDLPPFDDRPPAAASAATVALQDEVLAETAAAFPGTWRPEPIALRPCENDDDVKGWRRRVKSERTSGPPVDETGVEALADSLVALGFSEPDPYPAEGPSSMSTITDVDSFGDPATVVEVDFRTGSARVVVTSRGPCEVADDLEPQD